MNVSVKFLDLCLISWKKIIPLEGQTKGDTSNYSGLKTKKEFICMLQKAHCTEHFLRASHTGGSKSKCYGRGSFQESRSKVF